MGAHVDGVLFVGGRCMLRLRPRLQDVVNEQPQTRRQDLYVASVFHQA